MMQASLGNEIGLCSMRGFREGCSFSSRPLITGAGGGVRVGAKNVSEIGPKNHTEIQVISVSANSEIVLALITLQKTLI